MNTYITYTTEGTWRSKPRSYLPTYANPRPVPSRPPTLFALDRISIASHPLYYNTTTLHYHCCF